MRKTALVLTIWIVVILPWSSMAEEPSSCRPFECYQKALAQLQYARELVETQHAENQQLFEKLQQLTKDNQNLTEMNQKLVTQHQAILSLLQQKIAVVTADDGKIGIGNTKPQAKLDVNGTVKANVFQSQIKEFMPYSTVEPDSADKDFYANQECTFGSITAALVSQKNGVNKQASICTCLESKRGRGWFCWN
jgi:TolA-binding protein